MLNNNARKWVEALRSGKYAQARNVLRTDDRSAYCCLGVACKLAEQSGIERAWSSADEDLSEEAREWLGLRESDGTYGPGNKCLIIHNDKDLLTFAQIADIIESEPEGLFVSDKVTK